MRAISIMSTEAAPSTISARVPVLTRMVIAACLAGISTSRVSLWQTEQWTKGTHVIGKKEPPRRASAGMEQER